MESIGGDIGICVGSKFTENRIQFTHIRDRNEEIIACKIEQWLAFSWFYGCRGMDFLFTKLTIRHRRCRKDYSGRHNLLSKAVVKYSSRTCSCNPQFPYDRRSQRLQLR